MSPPRLLQHSTQKLNDDAQEVNDDKKTSIIPLNRLPALAAVQGSTSAGDVLEATIEANDHGKEAELIESLYSSAARRLGRKERKEGSKEAEEPCREDQNIDISPGDMRSSNSSQSLRLLRTRSGNSRSDRHPRRTR